MSPTYFRSCGLELAAEIAAGPSRAYAHMKHVFMAADAHDFRLSLDLEAMYMPGRSIATRPYGHYRRSPPGDEHDHP